MASPPLLHHGRSKLPSCVQQPVALRPRVGQTLPSGRQCYSAVTSPIMSCKSCASSLRPASTIPGYLRVESPRQINPVCADFLHFVAFFTRFIRIVAIKLVAIFSIFGPFLTPSQPDNNPSRLFASGML